MNFNRSDYSLKACLKMLQGCFYSYDTYERRKLESFYKTRLRSLIQTKLSKPTKGISDIEINALRALIVFIDVRLAKRAMYQIYRPKNSDKRGCLDRDKYRCVKCGSSKRLEVDHIKEICDGGTHELENLQTLCQPCHVIKTRKSRSERKKIMYPQVLLT